jgi:hypothetical protein
MFSYPKRFALLATSAAFAVLAVPAAARDLSTDRPDQTESPYTVDAGRTQAEFQLVSVGRETPGAGSAWQFAGLNLKRGLGRSVDLQLVFPGMESVPAGGERESGVGDLSVRLKWNMVGNDSEGIGFGLMPYATFPTGGESFTADGVEAGLIAPLAVPLPGGWGLGLMAQGDLVRDADGDGAHGEGFFTATVGRDLAGPLGGFVELAGRTRPAVEGPDPAFLDVGLTYGFTEDTQLDAGVQWGLSDGAEDHRFFLGYTFRR